MKFTIEMTAYEAIKQPLLSETNRSSFKLELIAAVLSFLSGCCHDFLSCRYPLINNSALHCGRRNVGQKLKSI